MKKSDFDYSLLSDEKLNDLFIEFICDEEINLFVYRTMGIMPSCVFSEMLKREDNKKTS